MATELTDKFDFATKKCTDTYYALCLNSDDVLSKIINGDGMSSMTNIRK